MFWDLFEKYNLKPWQWDLFAYTFVFGPLGWWVYSPSWIKFFLFLGLFIPIALVGSDFRHYLSSKKQTKIINSLIERILGLLNQKKSKMTASDIDAHLKFQNVELVKKTCEKMYLNGQISRTGNYRYFILSEENKKHKKASATKSEEIDVKSELKKFKEMLDGELIDQEDYDAKKKELLGL